MIVTVRHLITWPRYHHLMRRAPRDAHNQEFGGLNDVLWRLYEHGRRHQMGIRGHSGGGHSQLVAIGEATAGGEMVEDVWAASTAIVAGAQLRSTASLFDRPCLLGPLAAGQDTLTRMHANTQLPVSAQPFSGRHHSQLPPPSRAIAIAIADHCWPAAWPTAWPAAWQVLTGAHTRYEATGDGRFRRLAAFFVELLLRTRTFATGGSSIGEYWSAPNQLGELVAPGEGTTQESCSTHNMMRLSRGLLLTSDAEDDAATYADFHERALFNSVLGTQRGEQPGEMLYWLPLGAGVSKMDLRHPTHGDGQQHGWSHPHGDFWCCVGSGLEAFAKLGDSTFFRAARDRPPAAAGGGASVDAAAPLPTLYVMQLVSSRVRWREAAANVTLLVDEPGSLSASQPLTLTLSVTPTPAAASATTSTTSTASAATTSSSTSAVKTRTRAVLRVRLPSWAYRGNEPPAARVINALGTASALPPTSYAGRFLHVDREWAPSDRLVIAIRWPHCYPMIALPSDGHYDRHDLARISSPSDCHLSDCPTIALRLPHDCPPMAGAHAADERTVGGAQRHARALPPSASFHGWAHLARGPHFRPSHSPRQS